MIEPKLLIAVISGLGAMFGWGFADFFAKKTIDEMGDLATLFWSQLIGIFPLFLFFILSNSKYPDNSQIPILVILGVVEALAYYLLYKGFAKGQVSILSPLFASYIGVVVLLSVFIFGEQIPFLRWIALGVIFLGIVATCINPGNIKESISKDIKKGIPEILLALVIFSFWLISWSRYVESNGWLMILFVRIVITITIYVLSRINKVNLKVKKKKLWKFLFFIGISDVLAFSMLSYGYSTTSYVSIISVLSGAFSLPTIILARIFLKERLTLIQTVGCFIIIFGIVILSLF